MRIGQGYDVHRLTEGDHVMLGGVRIPHTQAVLAHSDGDVLLHALCDALLGALALGDIGHFYPPTDPAYRNISSRVLLRDVYAKIKQQGYILGNADLTLVAQAPKLAPYRQQIQQSIATDLGVESHHISVKATTTEGLGYTGRAEGIAAYAVVLLMQAHAK